MTARDDDELCPFCGEPQIVDVAEVWADHSFMLDTCCEGMRDAVALQLDEEHDEDRPNRSNAHWFRPVMGQAIGYSLRRVVPYDGTYIADYALTLRPVAFAAAVAFVREHHAHCKPPAGWKFGGQIHNGPTLIGVVMVGRPVARRLDAGGDTMEVTRLCLDRDLPDALRWNACSQAYSWAAKEARKRGARRIVTYTRQDEAGTSLRAAGWQLDAPTKGGTWSRTGRTRTSTNTVPKYRWSRSLIATKATAMPRLAVSARGDMMQIAMAL